jgi:type IV pilus assembly protein PilC
MPKFRYTAYDVGNKEQSGVVEALNLDLATSQVKSMGLRPYEVRAVEDPKAKKKVVQTQQQATRKKAPLTIGSIVSQKELTVFTRQLAVLIQAGLPLLRALEVLERQEKNVAFRFVVADLAETIRSGNTLSDGLANHPKVFDRLFVNMVRAGEAGGVLDVVLSRLAKFMEKAIKIKGKVKSAMTYPVIVMFVAVLVMAGLMLFIVPKFEDIFRDLLKGAELPALTQWVLGVSNFMKNNILVTLAIIGALVFIFMTLKATKQGQRIIDRAKIVLPPTGDLFKKAAIARFARTLGTLLQSGVPILQALTITRDTIGNTVIMEAIDKVHERVKEGEGVAGPLDQTKVFPSMVTSMIDVGEETGELPEMLSRVADTYDDDVDNAVAALTSIIEPIMIVFLAVLVGIIVIAMFLPIIKIIEELQK